MTERISLYTRQARQWLKIQWPRLWKYLVQPWWHRVITVLILIVFIFMGMMYGIGEWYVFSQRNKPLTLGVTFIPDYASYLGVDPQQTMDALIHDLGVERFRLVSYWSDIEPQQGTYNFSQLDWEFQKADAAHAQVTLAIGLRQPRWPECHAPSWANTAQPESQWYPALKNYMAAVINRYKDNPALQSYQLENEYLNSFGNCHNYDRSRLVSEFNMVKKLDPAHPVIISRSNNYGGFQLGQPRPDEFGVSIYRRVWKPLFGGTYIEYPFPSWYYAFLAGEQKIITGKDSIIHELQAEPWVPDGKDIRHISLAEQNKSFNAQRFKGVIQFAKNTGMKTIDLWGAEYWYYRWQVEGDKSVWNVAKAIFQSNVQH
ncbi:MAG TPA: beta-galactosidase [Candidatus Saccharimonadales bacterium]|nr:beta-galactosidase [Candidatus Saccharimonadales bacterium]